MTDTLAVPHTYAISTLHDNGKCRWCSQPEDGELHTEPPTKAIVVLTFSNWKEAVQVARDFGDPGDKLVDGRAVGLYRVPTQFCQCLSGKAGGGNKVVGYIRGPKFGWWVHRDCGKPSPHWAQGFGKRLLSVFGFNFLPDAPPEFEARSATGTTMRPPSDS